MNSEKKTKNLQENVKELIDEDSENSTTNNDIDSDQNKQNEQLLEFDSKIKLLEQERDNYKDLAIRMKADFDNFRKRLDIENTYKIEESQKRIFIELLNILDSFEIAIANFDSILKRLHDCNDVNKDEVSSNYKGLILTFEMLREFVTNHGIEEIKIEKGSMFDHNLHEILLQENNSNYKNREIIEVFQKGYLFKGKVLRTAKIKAALNEDDKKKAEVKGESND